MRHPLSAEWESVSACVRWLDHASATLNPQRHIHHVVRVDEVRSLMSTAPPPPPALQDAWSTQVWPVTGEPYVVYLLRCLAHQSGLTMLSPHFAVPTADTDASDDGSAGKGGVSESESPQLFRERCHVVGVRVEPAATNLQQMGWDTQPCLHCVARDSGAGRGGSRQPRVLPSILCGGDRCVECGHALALVPTWSRILFLVLQRHDLSRAPAVAYGEEVHRHLMLGASVDALLFTTVTAQREPLLVVHAAAPAAAGAVVASAAGRVPTPAPATAPTGITRDLLWQHCHAEEARRLAQQWGDAETAPSVAVDLGDVARRLAPQLQGQQRVKELLLLVVLHALYRKQHPSMNDPQERPLHLLLVGPAKTGKSALLREVVHLLGPDAGVISSTIVRSGRDGAARGASFLAALPVRCGALLMAGAGVTASAIVLDQLPSHAAAVPLMEVMERGYSGGCDADGTVADHSPFPSAIIAADGDESPTAELMAPYFHLVAAVTPTRSLDDTAIISHDVVAASRARSSTGTTCSRSSSRSAQPPSPCHPQRSTSASRGGSRSSADPCTATERLSANDVRHLVCRAADPALLNAVASHAACYDAFVEKLVDCAGLLEDLQCSTGCALPPPAACRGRRHVGGSVLAEDDGAALRAAPLPLQEHLRVLRALSQARMMLEPADRLRRMGWTAEMRDEVWALYRLHLLTCADLLQRRRGTPERTAVHPPTASWPPPPLPPMGSDVFEMQSTAGGPCRAAGTGPSRRPLSKKGCRLLLVDELRRLQHRLSHAAGVVAPAEVAALFERLGGCAAFQDTLDVVIGQLQEQGLVLRRPGGWCPA